MTNSYRPHLLILPEDDMNRQLANGFLLEPSVQQRAVQVLPFAGGWPKVKKSFLETHISMLRQYPDRHLILLIDFDNKLEERRQKFKGIIPDDVADRVYILGTLTEPEDLPKECNGLSPEKIGEALAISCYGNEIGLWGNRLLQHNQEEIDRLSKSVKPFLMAS